MSLLQTSKIIRIIPLQVCLHISRCQQSHLRTIPRCPDKYQTGTPTSDVPMTTDAILLSLHTHARHSHGKVCFANSRSMLPGLIHGANTVSHTNLFCVSLVSRERTHHPEDMLHGQGSSHPQPATPQEAEAKSRQSSCCEEGKVRS